MAASENDYTRRIRGKEYKLLVLRVEDTDLDGRPRGVCCMYDKDVTNVQDGMQFWIVWAPVKMCEPMRELPET